MKPRNKVIAAVLGGCLAGTAVSAMPVPALARMTAAGKTTGRMGATAGPAAQFCSTAALAKDDDWVSPDDASSGGNYIYNSTGLVGYVNVVLDKTRGCVFGWISGRNRGEIQGSVVKLQTSGYIDFRNIAYSWPGTVGSNSADGYAGGVFYNQYGEGWWWRACGWIGSGTACTYSWSFAKSGNSWSTRDGGKH